MEEKRQKKGAEGIGGEPPMKNMERVILCLYSLCEIFIFMVGLRAIWAPWNLAFVFFACILSWFVAINEYWNVRVRFVWSSVLVHLCFTIYMLHILKMENVLPYVITLAVIGGLSGVLEVVKINMLFSIFLCLYYVIHFFQMGHFFGGQWNYQMVQLVNVLMIEFLVFFWVKKRNQSSQQLFHVIKTLKEAEQSKDNFLANVSHEIRTPINTICGLSEVVLREEHPEKVQKNLLMIQSAGRNLMTVVSDILDFSELQSGKMVIVNEAYNITTTINDIMNMSMSMLTEKKIELVVDCDTNIPQRLYGDEKKIRRVVMNLVNNAIKFTEEGYVGVDFSYRKEEYGINLCVTVKDTGIGMSEENMEKLFQSFSQIDTKRNREKGGLGLGLAISQSIVKAMGGVITVKSMPNKGTIIKFVIPQQVLDEKPLITLEKKEQLNLAVYINMEQFNMTDVRDAYSCTIRKMIEQFRVKCHVCRSLAELKRREENEDFTHIFISSEEYKEDQTYFDELALRTKVVMLTLKTQEKRILNSNFIHIYKPVYVIPIVSVLNGNTPDGQNVLPHNMEKFTAPDAHILVVDDNMMNLEVIDGMLEEYEIQVTKADSGKEALELIKSKDYDFVFMDHMMPEMDGIETFHHIREKAGAYYQQVPVIALTANAVAGAREMFIEEGFADFLEKPIEASVLDRVLRRNLPENKIIIQKQKEKETSHFSSEETVQEKVETNTNVSKEDEKESDAGEESLVIGDLDVKKGIYYCDGKERYIKILKIHTKSAKGNRDKIQELFEKEDWKDYTINVHGIKSSMLTIGAVKLSEMAKKLEFAGKEGDITYIKENHAAMIEEFDRVTGFLQSHPLLAEQKKVKTQEKNLTPIEEKEFSQRLEELENAMFELDGECMTEILKELKKCSYMDVGLDEPMEPLLHKVEMSDYMSAVEAVAALKKDIEQKGGE